MLSRGIELEEVGILSKDSSWPNSEEASLIPSDNNINDTLRD